MSSMPRDGGKEWLVTNGTNIAPAKLTAIDVLDGASRPAVRSLLTCPRRECMTTAHLIHGFMMLAATGVMSPIAPAQTTAPDQTDRKIVNLAAGGAHEVPAKRARVLASNDDLRVLAMNDDTHLVVQAIIPADGDDTIGESEDGRPIGDSSTLQLDVDADERVTPRVDRTYGLDPWPHLPGLQYSIEFGDGASSGLQSDSGGRGAITYHETADGIVRIDTYVIPLAEIGRSPGDTIRLALYVSSPNPAKRLNSVGYEHDGVYYGYHLPLEDYHTWTLVEGERAIDVSMIPDAREQQQVAAAQPPRQPVPAIGTVPPELEAADWINTDEPLTLKALRGNVVVVEFWATWCGPCVAGIPHLNELHERYAGDGLRIVSFTDQSRRGVDNFREKTVMNYAIGTGSSLARDYGVTAIPHAFIIGRDGRLRWHGNPGDKQFDREIIAALGGASG